MKRSFVIFSAISLFALIAKAEPLAVGSKAPSITAKDQDGEPVSFGDVYSKGLTLVYFLFKSRHCRVHGASLLPARFLCRPPRGRLANSRRE